MSRSQQERSLFRTYAVLLESVQEALNALLLWAADILKKSTGGASRWFTFDVQESGSKANRGVPIV